MLVAWITVVCLLLPMLLVVLPTTATAAEQAFFQDLGARNNCLDLGGSGKGKMPHHDGSQCCILCVASAFPVSPAVESTTAVAFEPARYIQQPPFIVLAISRATLADAATAPITGRGPPA